MAEQEAHELAVARAEAGAVGGEARTVGGEAGAAGAEAGPSPAVAHHAHMGAPMRPDRCRWGCCCYRSWCPCS